MRAATMDPAEPKSAEVPPETLAGDPRWQLIERIAESEAFQKSSRLPVLIRYLARCTLSGDRHGLSEQSIGRAVLNKREDYNPTEDSSVRVYIRQLRIRLREFYQADGKTEPIIVDLPKGGYALSFTEVAPAERPSPSPPLPRLEVPRPDRPLRNTAALIAVLAVAVLVCGLGWLFAAEKQHRTEVPWPLQQVVSEHKQTMVVLADVGYSLRLLGTEQVSLDHYIDRSYLKQLIPQNMDKGEARLIHYLAASQTTSIADAEAAASITALASTYGQNLVIRSARSLTPDDLTRGNLIFIGARTSNPWVELFDDSLNFQVVEDLSAGTRSIRNRSPKLGEQAAYAVPESTGTSGEDYAIIALLPNRSGSGNVLLIEGLRMEGTEAAIKLLQNSDLRSGLQADLRSANKGVLPPYFEALIHARSIAGAPVSVEFLSVRPLAR